MIVIQLFAYQSFFYWHIERTSTHKRFFMNTRGNKIQHLGGKYSLHIFFIYFKCLHNFFHTWFLPINDFYDTT